MARQSPSFGALFTYLACLLALCSLFSACGDSSTELIVAIHSNLNPGSELTAVKVRTYVADGSGSEFDSATYQIAGGLAVDDEVRLPFKVTVTKGKKQTFLLVVTGYGKPSDEPERVVVEYKARVTFRNNQRLLLKVFLGRACLDHLCDANTACYAFEEHAGPPGECVDITELDDLPEARRGHELGPIDLNTIGASDTIDAGFGDSDASDAGQADELDAIPTQEGGPAADAAVADASSETAASEACPSGFRRGADGCQDINECFEGIAKCHLTAACINNDGSYDCTCPDGYSGGTNQGIACMPRIVTGRAHACGLDRNGTVVCWGDNEFGQLGDGTDQSRPTPAPVKGLAPAASIVAGRATTCAILKDGSVGCWGENAGAEWGQGSPTPIALQGLNNVAHLSVTLSDKPDTACAIDRDGVLSCWGHNVQGQAGIGSSAPYIEAPTRVDIGAASWVSMSRWGAAGCAALRDRSAYCWGADLLLSLASTTFTTSSIPVRVSDQSDVALVYSMFQRNCAVHYGGALYCWGNDAVLPTHSGQANPIAKLGGISGIDAGLYHTCIAGRSGGVVCWAPDTPAFTLPASEDVVAIAAVQAGPLLFGLTKQGEVNAWWTEGTEPDAAQQGLPLPFEGFVPFSLW